MWFMDGDEVSIHTLAAAAYQIIHDLKEHTGIVQGLLYDAANVKDEHRNKWINFIKKPMNFFKHADKDPEGMIEFRPIGSLVYMAFGATGLRLLGERTSYTVNAFTLWLVINRPTWLTVEFLKLFEDSLGVEDIPDFKLVPKSDFFELYRRASEAGKSIVQPD